MKFWCLVFLSIVMLSGCAVNPVDLSQGAPDKALVYFTQYTQKAPLLGRYFYQIQLLSVNGKDISELPGNNFYLRSGENTLTVKMTSHGAPWSKIYTPVDVKFYANSGESYVLKLEKTNHLLTRSVLAYTVAPFNGSETPIVSVD